MGGVFIKKLVIYVWSVTIIFIAFLVGAAGADLQCENSQIKSVISNNTSDTNQTFIEYLPGEVSKIIKESKKVP